MIEKLKLISSWKRWKLPSKNRFKTCFFFNDVLDKVNALSEKLWTLLYVGYPYPVS